VARLRSYPSHHCRDSADFEMARSVPHSAAVSWRSIPDTVTGRREQCGKSLARVKHGSAAVRYYRLRRRGWVLRNLNRVPDLRVTSGAKSRAGAGQLTASSFLPMRRRTAIHRSANLKSCSQSARIRRWRWRLDRGPCVGHIARAHFGGVPVSTWGTRQRRHAEDDALASLNIASKHNC
jgi:hypothetical protein